MVKAGHFSRFIQVVSSSLIFLFNFLFFCLIPFLFFLLHLCGSFLFRLSLGSLTS